MSFFSGRMALCALSCLPFLPASASELSLSEAQRLAQRQHPLLAAFLPQQHIIEARRQHARLQPPLQLEGLWENLPSTGSRGGLNQAQLDVQVLKTLEHPAQLESRVQAIEAEGQWLTAQQQQQRLALRQQVGMRFFQAAQAQSRVVLAKKAVRLAEATLNTVRQRVEAARVPVVEQRRAEVQLAEMHLEEEHQEHQAVAALQALGLDIGQPVTAVAFDPFDPAALPAVADFAALKTQLPSGLVVLEGQRRFYQAEGQRLAAQAKGTVQVSLGLRYLTQTQDVALVGGLSVPLLRGRPQPEVAEAQAKAAEVEAHQALLLQQREQQLFEAVQDLNHCLLESRTLQKSILPTLRRALSDVQYAYERGRYSYLEWVQAQKDLLAQEQRALDIAINAQQQALRIQSLTDFSEGTP